MPPSVLNDSNVGDNPNIIGLYVGARIRLRRFVLAMTEEELADAAGVPAEVVRAIESGTEPLAVPRLHQFGQLLNVPVSWFFAGLGLDGEVQYGGRIAAANDASDAYERAADLERLKHCFETLSHREHRQLVLQMAQILSDLEGQHSIDNSGRN